MDGSGPPPLDKEKIMEIPVAVIDQEQVGEWKVKLIIRNYLLDGGISAVNFFFM